MQTRLILSLFNGCLQELPKRLAVGKVGHETLDSKFRAAFAFSGLRTETAVSCALAFFVSHEVCCCRLSIQLATLTIREQWRCLMKHEFALEERSCLESFLGQGYTEINGSIIRKQYISLGSSVTVFCKAYYTTYNRNHEKYYEGILHKTVGCLCGENKC